MREAVSQSLYAYWNGLRGERLAPRRFEIEPSSISSYLPDTFILERIDHANLRFRLAGTRISEAFGVELRGTNLLDLFETDDRQALQGRVATVVSQGAVGVFHVAAGNGNKFSTAFEVLLLPLVHTRDVVDRFLGSVAPIDKPKWLGTMALTERKLLGHELVWPDGRPRGVAEGMHRQMPFLPTVREAKIVRSKRRQFRVYEGGLSRLADD